MTHRSLKSWKCVNACPVVQETGSETLVWALRRIILNLHGLWSIEYDSLQSHLYIVIEKESKKKKRKICYLLDSPFLYLYTHIYMCIYIYIYIYNHRCLYTEYMVYNIMYNVYCMKKHMDTRESGTRKSPTKSKGKEEPWK